MRIAVKEQLGNDVVSREHGAKMKNLLEAALKDSKPPVVVDFAGMKITSVSFFDESFGALAKLYGEDLLKKVELVAIDPFDLHLVRDIVASRARETSKKLNRSSPVR